MNLDLDMILRLITALGITSLVGLFWRREVNLRKLSNENTADIRDHYAGEVKALRDRLEANLKTFRDLETHWRDMLDASDRRHKECEDARHELRKELTDMHSELAGLKRQIARYSSDKAILLEDDKAPMAQASAERVKNIIKEQDNGQK